MMNLQALEWTQSPQIPTQLALLLSLTASCTTLPLHSNRTFSPRSTLITTRGLYNGCFLWWNVFLKDHSQFDCSFKSFTLKATTSHLQLSHSSIFFQISYKSIEILNETYLYIYLLTCVVPSLIMCKLHECGNQTCLFHHSLKCHLLEHHKVVSVNSTWWTLKMLKFLVSGWLNASQRVVGGRIKTLKNV